MKIVIFGAGALGLSLINFIKQDIEVIFTDFDSYIDKLLKENFSNSKYKFEYHKNIKSADLILWCLKAYQYKKILPLVNINANEHISISNGMDYEEEFLRKNIFLKKIITNIGAYKSNIGEIHYQAGKIFYSENTVQSITKIFHQNIIEYSTSINSLIWTKLIYNAIINPLTAIYKIKNNELTQKYYLPIKRAIFDEILQIAVLKKIHLSENLFDEIENFIESSENYSSMYQDLKNKRETEIDYINGAFINIAQKYSLTLPTNELILYKIKDISANNYRDSKYIF